jgi:hypothetical protein
MEDWLREARTSLAHLANKQLRESIPDARKEWLLLVFLRKPATCTLISQIVSGHLDRARPQKERPPSGGLSEIRSAILVQAVASAEAFFFAPR